MKTRSALCSPSVIGPALLVYRCKRRWTICLGIGPRTVTCFAGLSASAVPVQVGEKVIGFLQTGQVALRKPTASQFGKILKQLTEWGVKVDLPELEDAYFHSRFLEPQQYVAMVKLLETFAKHLSLLANQIVAQEQEAESPLVRRARAYILANQADPIDLDKVARSTAPRQEPNYHGDRRRALAISNQPPF